LKSSGEMKNTGSRFRSLRWRIIIILATGTGVVAIAAMLLVSVFLVDQMQEGLEQKSRALAMLLSANLGAALEFDDKDAALETMAGLKHNSELKYAALYKEDGSVFVTIGKLPQYGFLQLSGNETHKIIEQPDMIHVASRIIREKTVVGQLQIGFSLDDMLSRSFRIRVAGIIICVLLILAMTLYFSYAMNRTVVQPISQMTEFVQRMGQGDLREDVFSTEALKKTTEISLMWRAIARTTQSFRESVQSIQQASNEFASIADSIFASSSQLSNTATQQVDSVIEAFSTAKKMESTGEETATSAREISGAAETSVEISGEGLGVVSDSVSQFHSVRDQVQTVVDAVDKLNAQLSQVDAIVVSVADVAKQSQLLAVNASIEAAKAGAAGLRFAVVAREIKNLAVQSQNATDTVRRTLGNVKNGIKNIAEASENGRRRASRGMTSIENGGRVINRLAEVINNTAKAARQISNNTETQVRGLREMSDAMFQIDDLSKSNLVAVREIERYGEKLNSKAREMKQLVSKFQID
jgi:methyl-accepting chemotaxis protein